MPVLYCLSPLPTLLLHYYDRSSITESVRNNNPPNNSNMLDAFFAGRRRPACAPQPSATSAPTMSPYTSEELIGMYTSRSPAEPPADGIYVPSNRSSYSPGEARKSLLAYMDSDNYSYTEGAGGADRSRPVSVVVARGSGSAAGGDGLAGTNATAENAGLDHPDRTPRSAVTQQQNAGFLASVWALGRYLSVATSTREVVNDVVTMAAGFKREKRSYAASVGSSANMDDFVGSEEGESVTEEEYEGEEEDMPYHPHTIDKGKNREIRGEYEAGGPSNRGLAHAPIPSPPSTATETVVADRRWESDTETETVLRAVVSVVEATVPEFEAMPRADQGPILERHQSKSQTELRPSPEVVSTAPRRSPSLTEFEEAEKDARQDDIREVLCESITAAEAVAAAPGPVIVTELPKKEPVAVKDSTPEPTPVAAKADAPLVRVEIPANVEDAPQTPLKSPFRTRNSVSESPNSSHHELALPEVSKAESVEEEGEIKAQGGEKEVPAIVPEEAKVETKETPEKASTDLKNYSQALSGMLLNPTAHSIVVEAPETATTEIPQSTPEISESTPEIPAEALVEAPTSASIETLTTAPIEASETAAPEDREFPVAEFSDTIISTPLPPIAEAKEEKREPTKVEESLRKISVDSKVSAPTEAVAAVTPTPEANAEEKTAEKTEEKAEKPPSITNPRGGLERRMSNAFRRDTIQRSMSMFRKKDKNKSKDSNELPATSSAVELTPPPTPPPHIDDLGEKGEKGESPAAAERPKTTSRMSMFSITKTLKEKAGKEAAEAPAATTADGDSAIAALSSNLASEVDKSTPSTSVESPAAPAPEKPDLRKKSSFISVAESFRSQRPSTSASKLTTKEGEEGSKTSQRRPTFRPFSSPGDKSKSRTKSWFSGDKKPKVNEKGELVDPNFSKDDDGPITPDNASSIAPSIQEPATPVAETPTKEAKPKFFRSPSVKRATAFGLANRSLSSSAVSMGTTATTATDETGATGATGTDTPTKTKGAARMKGLVKASTFMGMNKKKDKGKGKDVAAE